MALLAISLLLLSTAFLSEAIDSVGIVPDLKMGPEPGTTNKSGTPSCGLGQNCDVKKFLNESYKMAILSVEGQPGTSYLRAVVFGDYEGGVWSPPRSPRKPYIGEKILIGVSSYSERTSRNIEITPLVNMTGYIPLTLNLKSIIADIPLQYVRDLLIFYSETPFNSNYSFSYDVYSYDEDLLESARVVVDPSYMEIPIEHAGWLTELAEMITANSSTPYGRIRSIISFLKENYVYNLVYPPAPEGVDPVKWFLMGSKEGVCTHFNSALVLLARSLGIPARLAGGYLIRPNLDIQLIYTEQKHAFAEIGFKELGWITFDATPAAGCSECEGSEGGDRDDGDKPGTCRPRDSIYNRGNCTDCVNDCTKLSPEDEENLDLDLFEINGITGSRYLRTMVGERYDDELWSMERPNPQPYIGLPIAYAVSGYVDSSRFDFSVTPLVEMGGFIPTARYTDSLSRDSGMQHYADQLIFFSEDIFVETYFISGSNFEFDHEILRNAVTVLDSRYLDMPYDLYIELIPLALEATSGAETPYDKLVALETYLKSNYVHSINYTRAPDGVDPVEWFLFHEMRGTCANFNSAFVLLARSIGLPARYVVGYAIDPNSKWQVVHARQSHGYSEVPFEELGWITFDPTPAAGCSECEGAGCSKCGGGDGDAGDKPGTCSPCDSIYNQSSCTDCVNNCTKLSAEGGLPPKMDLFQIHGVTGVPYLRTMVGESYDGVWDMAESSPEDYEGGVIGHEVHGYISSWNQRFMVSPLVEMGGFIPVTLYVTELDIDWPIQRYPEQQIYFSSAIFNSSYLVSSVRFEYDQETLRGASLVEDFRYLDMPPKSLNRLRPLALEATSGAETPYDKLVALETYLKSNYVYDINYTRAPDNIDPVEWFLFAEKRGVCANFNSAFVLLARSIGLPARFVVGYAIDAKAETQTVNSRQGHGYSEVPFEELGWVTFDATGPYPTPEEKGDDEDEGIRILETSTEITSQESVGVKGETFTVIGVVRDENGNPVDGLRTLAYLKLNKTEEGLLLGEGTVIEGSFNLTCSLPYNITVGDYFVDAHTLGDSRYNGSWSDPPIKVVSKTDILLTAPDKVIAGRPFTLQGNLTEYRTGAPLSNTTIDMKIGLDEVRLDTDGNGLFTSNYTIVNPGEFTMELEWPGSEYFLRSHASSSVKILPLMITPDTLEMMVRQEEVLIAGRVHAEELIGDGEEVVISIDHQVIGTALTDGEGRFSFTYDIPRTQELGDVQIEYQLTNGPYSTTKQSAVYARTRIEIEAPSSVKAKTKFTFEAQLRDDLGNLLEETELTMAEEGRELEKSITTGAEGTSEVTHSIKRAPEDGSVSLSVSFEGKEWYIASTEQVSIDVTRPISMITSVLMLSVLSLVGYTGYVVIQRRLRQGEVEPEEGLVEDEPEPVEETPYPGIVSVDEKFWFDFPQIVDPFPLVWGLGEELVFRVGLAENEETVNVQIVVDEVGGTRFDLSGGGRFDHPLSFNERGYHEIKVVLDADEVPETVCKAIIRIVVYREEVNDLFNKEFEKYEETSEDVKRHFTAREFMRSILGRLPEGSYELLNEMVSIFEIADYSLHDVTRREYERFYAAKHEFEEMKGGD
ncbi:hypothetical protein ES707_11352 [subsurface metagenome]